ncbi:molybdenum ABC transporter ATP-binding protein [Rhizobium sp. SSA_523]|uniref:molybdenum ABC transporter ATP-binding protein n=1 Tax=Rhizobium sp. SSA_523 TaxID=2952477 RepID=UPI0020919635|nr:molybdenum ABC transporter ATP-binding protein [Rhizobium sp. SSA_523]MCO5734498.1 molybdenum ABC transporter ATP-binding protein [Rhizobium sp. SSA_523]WKC23255.1 molybdenum ABC transporter ATP-binding protein [Rhizobium sp. SSA_523]
MTLTVEIRHRQGAFDLDVSFQAEGGVTAIFGASGSGKTSILRILGGLARPDHGVVRLQGDVILDTQRRIFTPAHRLHFGYVFQEPRLFPHLTVLQNLSYGRWLSRRRAMQADLDQIVDLLGIGHLLGRRPETLSGGERQRVSIGRALLSSPRLLLMDEPLSALDQDRKAEILPYLERLRDGLDLPILYVSHSVEEVARLADRLILLQQGKVKAVGAASELLGGAAEIVEGAAGSVLTGQVGAVEPGAGVATIVCRGMSLMVPNSGLRPEARVRVHIPARDVLVATEEPRNISALNVLPGRIAAIAEAPGGTVDLSLCCGEETIHARITAFSLQRLELHVGRPVFAIIKTVALKRPGSP